ncbi:hypothetical protein Dimus_029188 [Dionaea muscipula]
MPSLTAASGEGVVDPERTELELPPKRSSSSNWLRSGKKDETILPSSSLRTSSPSSADAVTIISGKTPPPASLDCPTTAIDGGSTSKATRSGRLDGSEVASLLDRRHATWT